jgi:hypothetical protein
VEQAVREGVQGPLEVNGVSYDGVMPPPPGLSDEEIQAVAAYVAADLELPGGAAAPDLPPASGTAATELPIAVVAASVIGFLLAFGVLALVLGPVAVARTDRIHLSWPNAWLKTAFVIVFFVAATALLPSLVLKSAAIASLPRVARDLVGTGVWVAALGFGLWGLRWAQRSNRI